MENLGKSIFKIFDNQNKYIIPLYQRNFSWRREQIEQLLQDIYNAFKQNPCGHYYIGSLVVLKRSNGDLEVIDGQQRLTVLSLITKILGINNEPRLFYDSRPEVEDFFKAFYDSKDGSCNFGYSQTAHLENAIEFIKEIDLDADKHTGKIGEANKIIKENVSFCDYFKNNVILVRVEIPQDTDVASYFEIMNNRGAQLQKHEILKSFLLDNLNKKSSDEFAKIWTACSQMDTPIQKLFVKDRDKYFGDSYDMFCFKGLTKIKKDNESNDNNEVNDSSTLELKKLDDILNMPLPTPSAKNVNQGNGTENNVEGDGAETKYKSIIDFPNFLMHVFKVMFPQKVIPLNEKYLLDTYYTIKEDLDSDKFIKSLLFCRTVFDRYVVKTSPETSNNRSEDGEKWCLIKPRKYENGWDYVNTFGLKKENDNEKKVGQISDEQKRIVKALSMLQVSFSTRTYKNWLYDILTWFYNEKDRIEKEMEVDYKEYIQMLDKIILKNFENSFPEINEIIKEGSDLTKDNSYSQGCNTPHFLFNFIDYLYWVDSKKKQDNRVKDFEFKYWNSVEHHLARQLAKDTPKNGNYEDYIDNLGNLCLISKGSNSRLSDRSIEEKITRMKDMNMGANRQIIYAESKDSEGKYSWNENKIKHHYNELLDLLRRREEILKYTE